MTIESPPDRGRIAVLDPLRALAAFAVAWFHISHEMALVPQDSLLFRSSTIGRAGVEVFFVISGFVIPYALYASGYKVRNYGRFMLKRLIRLEPPYIAAILLSAGVAGYNTWLRGALFPYTLPQLLAQIGYLNLVVLYGKGADSFFYPWINPVFWTLFVELQYYLLIGLAFPLLLRRNLFWLVIAPLCLFLTAGDHYRIYLVEHFPFFLLGVAAFHYRRGMLSGRQFSAVLAVLALFAGWTAPGVVYMPSPVGAVAGALTAIVIAVSSYSAPAPTGLGAASYSLYLIHVPIGGFVGGAVARSFPWMPPIAVVVVTLAFCSMAAWGIYLLIERPSVQLSKRIRYSRAPRVAEAASGFAAATQ